MMQFKSAGATGSVEKIVSVSEGDVLYRYFGFSCLVSPNKTFGFPEGHITKAHLANLTGTEDEKLTAFFEKLVASYEARSKGDIDGVNTLYGEIGLSPMKEEPREVKIKKAEVLEAV